jgi:hypothetical protein
VAKLIPPHARSAPNSFKLKQFKAILPLFKNGFPGNAGEKRFPENALTLSLGLCERAKKIGFGDNQDFLVEAGYAYAKTVGRNAAVGSKKPRSANPARTAAAASVCANDLPARVASKQ